MPSEVPSFRRHIHKGAPVRGGEEGIVGGGAAFGGNKKTLSDRGMTNFPKKNRPAVLTVFPYGRIVRLFAASEAANELKSIAQNVGGYRE
ncbi:hypothetical protein, partial [Neisseria polysaccharea]|uniref:hypothetical protein n=2 Tax=Neisseria polysaccharea TaxID=489 RepID=UPI00272CA072